MVDFKWCSSCRQRVWTPNDVCNICQSPVEEVPVPSERNTLRTGVCPKCQSQDIIPDWPIEMINTSFGQEKVKIKIAAKPEAVFKRNAEIRELRTWICGTCGHVELFIDGAKGLWDAYQQGYAEKRNTKVIAQSRQCEHCHNIVSVEALFCEQCGERLSSAGKSTNV